MARSFLRCVLVSAALGIAGPAHGAAGSAAEPRDPAQPPARTLTVVASAAAAQAGARRTISGTEQWVNLISNGNDYARPEYENASIDRLCEVLKGAGVTGVSLRAVWSAFETFDQTLKPAPVANLRRVAERIAANGLGVALDFHTLFNDKDSSWMIPAATPAATITLGATGPGSVTLTSSEGVFTPQMASEQWQIWENDQREGPTRGIFRITGYQDSRRVTGEALRGFDTTSYKGGQWKLTRGRYFDMWDPDRPVTRDAYRDFVLRVMQHEDAAGLPLYRMPAWLTVSILNEPYLYWGPNRPPFWANKRQADAVTDFHRVVDLLTQDLRALRGWDLPIGVRFLANQNPWRTANDIKRFSTPAETLARLDWVGGNFYWQQKGARPTGLWDDAAYLDGTGPNDPNRVRTAQVMRDMVADVHAAGKAVIVTEVGTDVGNAQWRQSHFAWMHRRFQQFQINGYQIWNAQNDGLFWSTTSGGFNIMAAPNVLAPGIGAFADDPVPGAAGTPARAAMAAATGTVQPWPQLTLTGTRPTAALSVARSGASGLASSDQPTAATTNGPAFSRADVGREIRALDGGGIGIIDVAASATEVKIFHAEGFTDTSYPAGSWELTDARTMSRMLANRGPVQCDWDYDVTMTIPPDTFTAGDVVSIANFSRRGAVTIAAGQGVRLQSGERGRAATELAAASDGPTTATLEFTSANEAVLRKP